MSGFSRHDSNGVWNTAYLGVYGQGLGVTNVHEDGGTNNRHVVDNLGGDHDYVMFEFDSSIVVTQAFLDYVYNGDSDISIWIGTKTNPYTTHNTLSDAFLTSLGAREDNNTNLHSARLATFNAINKLGNVVVISAAVTGSNDTFKLHKLFFGCTGGATPTPNPTATATATATATPSSSCSPGTFTFEGNTATSGTAGNVRTFNLGAMTVKVSGFNRVDSNGAWSTAYLGVYAHGLGVTNFSEGNGSNDQHVVDNVGGNRDYVLFEFSTPIVVDQVYLDYIVGDSDMSVWIGTTVNPIVNHNTLSDAFLTSLGTQEDNNTSSSSPRWADINAANKVGNTIVISASASDTTADDGFKIHRLLFGCQGGGPSPTTTPCGTSTNPTAIAIPDEGIAAPYPSNINVAGISGLVTKVTVKLMNFSHTWANDVDVLLVGPGGQKMRLLENAGTGPTNNATLTFSDSAAGSVPENGSLPTGTFKPTAYAPATSYPAPAPAGPYGTTLSVFNGAGANGTWSLYVLDDGPGDQGSFADGWELNIFTDDCDNTN